MVYSLYGVQKGLIVDPLSRQSRAEGIKIGQGWIAQRITSSLSVCARALGYISNSL